MSKEINQNIVFYAFRYALGRRTYAVSDVVDYLKENWEELDNQTQVQIRNEIGKAIDREQAGSHCDIKKWRELL